jgi:hypothetical protein
MMGDTCQNPRCDEPASDTYEGENGNTIRLCEEHYYNLVTRSCGGTSNADPLVPFWDSGVRNDSSSGGKWLGDATSLTIERDYDRDRGL